MISAAYAGVTYVVSHAPCLDAFDKLNEEHYAVTVRAIRRSIEICHLLGIKRTVVHASSNPAFTVAEYYQCNKRFYGDLFDLMEKYDITVMTENMPSPVYTPLSTGKEMREFMEYLDHPLIGACWDTAHANLNEKARREGQYQCIVDIGDKLKGLHISDNFGDGAHHHSWPFAGIINFDSVMQALLDVKYDGFFNFEASYTLLHQKNLPYHGAVDGYRYIFKIDPKGLANPMVWVYALGQSFFSLSLAGNGTIIYGSYLDDDVDVVSSAWKVALFDTMAAMLAALVIIPAMASMGSKLDQGGPGLLFIYLPNLFRSLPGSRLLMILFFIAVLFAGLTSLLNLFEAPIAAVQSHIKLSRAKAVLLVGSIGLVVSVCIQGIVSGWMDILSIFICPLGAGLAGILFFWILGKKNVEDEVSKGRANRIGTWYYSFGKYVFCTLTLLVLVLGIVFGGIG